jgi:hypothetical protein
MSTTCVYARIEANSNLVLWKTTPLLKIVIAYVDRWYQVILIKVQGKISKLLLKKALGSHVTCVLLRFKHGAIGFLVLPF